ESPSYLYGTMHVRDQEAFNFTDSVLAKLYEVECFAMEVHPDSAIKAIIESAIKNRDQEAHTLEEVMEEEEFAAMDQRFQQETGVSLKGVTTDRLFQVKYMLGEVPPEEGDAETFVDAYLYKLARAWGKKALGLEEPEDQIGLLANTSVEEFKQLLESESKIQESKEVRNQLLEIYQQGDLESVETMIQGWRAYDSTYYRMMLTDRNLVMANSMEKIMAKQSLFAAVGTAHLPGDDGVIALLRDRGYELEAVPASFTGVKEKFEALPRLDIPWVKHEVSRDGYAVDFPTAPIAISPEDVPMTMYMNVDMGSSMVYMTASLVSGNIDPSDEEKKEQLFETMAESMKNNNALGELLSFHEVEEITYQGVEGRQWIMSSENWRAPEMHLRIFIKEGMLCMLLAGKQTKGEQDDDIQQFFNSLRFLEIPEQEWMTMSDEKGAFSVSFPEKAKREVQVIEGEGQTILVERFEATSRKDGSHFGSIVYYYEADSYFPNDTGVVKLSMDGIAERFPKVEILEDTIYRKGEYAFGKRKMDLHFLGLMAEVESWTRGSRLHNNMVIYSRLKGEPESAKFFDSFRFLDYQPVQWQNYEEPNGDFTVQFPVGEVQFIGDTAETGTYYFNPDWLIQNQYLGMDSNSSISYSVLMDEAGPFYEIADQDSFMLLGMEDFRYEDGVEMEMTILSQEDMLGRPAIVYTRISPNSPSNEMKIVQILDDDRHYTLMSIYPVSLREQSRITDFFESFSLGGEAPDQSSLLSSKKMNLIEALQDSNEYTKAIAWAAFNDYSFGEADTSLLLPLLYSTKGGEDQRLMSPILKVNQQLQAFQTEGQLQWIKKAFSEYDEERFVQYALMKQLLTYPAERSRDLFYDLLMGLPDTLRYSGYQSAFFSHAGYDDPGVWALEEKLPVFQHLDELKKRPGYLFPLTSLYGKMLDSGLVASNDYPQLVQQIEDSLEARLARLSVETEEDYYNYQEIFWLRLLAKLDLTPRRTNIFRGYAKHNGVYMRQEALLALLKQGEKVKKKEWQFLADFPENHWEVYQRFCELGQASRYPFSSKETDLALSKARSMVYEYEGDASFEIESISTQSFTHEGQVVELYFYRFGWPDEEGVIDYWSMVSVGNFHPDTQGQIVQEPAMNFFEWGYDTEDESEIIQEILDRAREFLTEDN
ncbi:MAG: TraB/GumN family protein, partial [Bacteroidota bacterium]